VPGVSPVAVALEKKLVAVASSLQATSVREPQVPVYNTKPVSFTDEPVTALVVTVTLPEAGTTTLYHTSLLTGVAATKQPVPVVELGAGTPAEAVAPVLVVVIGVQVVATVKVVAVAHSSLAGATAGVLNEVVMACEVVVLEQLPATDTL
jgi:hypothetical protein